MMRDRYDVVVAGAGLGGLSAAARLARAGLSVLVVEPHDRPGGYATTFRRGRFEFEVSLHLIDAIGSGEPNHSLLEDVGLGDIALFRPDTLRTERWNETELRIPWGVDRYHEAVAGAFPADRDGLRQLLERARRVHEAFATDDVEVPALTEESRATAAAVVDAHVGTRGLRASLDLFARGWLGLPLETLAAIPFLVAWYSYHAFGGYYPSGGSGALSAALARAVTENGGDVQLKTLVRHIVVRRGRVEAVEIEGAAAARIETRAVVSNIHPAGTFALVGDDQIDDKTRRRTAALVPSVSCVKAWIGLDRDLAELEDAYDTYLEARDEPRDRFDPERCGVSVVRMPDATGNPTLAVTALVPAGTDVSRSAATALVDRVERELLPGLRSRAEIIETATPRTFERYTRNPGGCIYGCSPTVDQIGRRPKSETCIDGLWLAGAWTHPGGGFSSVMRSGRDAARAALRAQARRG